MRIWVLVSALVVVSSNVHAQEPFEQMGLGLRSCAQFAKDYKANPELTETMYFSWATGLMTGMNLAAAIVHGDMRNLGATAPEEMRRLMRQFCDQYPLKTYKDGVLKLYFALPAMKPQR